MGIFKKTPKVQSITSLGAKTTKATPSAKAAKNLTGKKLGKLQSSAAAGKSATDQYASNQRHNATHKLQPNLTFSASKIASVEKKVNKRLDKQDKKDAKKAARGK